MTLSEHEGVCTEPSTTEQLRANEFSAFMVSGWAIAAASNVLMGKISHLFQMLLNFANDTEEGLDFFMYLSDVSAPKTLFVPLNSGFADNEVSKQR